MSAGLVLFNDASENPTTSPELRFDDSMNFPHSRLNTVNVHVEDNIVVNGQLGIATANPRKELEVSGYSLLVGRGSDSQEKREFGLNGSYDTLSIMSPSGLGTGGRMSIFFGLTSVTNYPIARIVAGDIYGRTTLAFQTGVDKHLVERMRIDTNGYIGIGTPSPQYMLDVSGMAHISNNVFLNGQSILYKTYSVQFTTAPPETGSVYLNFPNVGEASATTIDIQFSMCGIANQNHSTIAKFTAFLSGYSGTGTGLYVNNISVQKNGTAFFGPYNINTNSYDPSGLSIQIDYVNTPVIAYIHYSAYGPGAKKITQINVTPTPLVGGAVAATVPSAPGNVQATGSPGQASVSWTTPTNNGGSDILGYIVSWPGGSQIETSTSTTITGLNNGSSYSFTVVAVNIAGNSISSGPSNTVFLASAPDPPVNVVAVRGNGQASLSWSAPSNNGGVSITDYFISYSGGSTTTGGTSSTITGLSNGTPYTFTVYARNSVGSSSGGNSNTVIPATIPNAPQNVTATALGSGNVRLTWSAPSSNGGDPIDTYIVIDSTGNNQYDYKNVGLVYTFVVSYQSNVGLNFVFRVYSHNSLGRSLPSGSSNAVLIT